jgi:DNA-directed RNA polymerase specialized sigma24 family protein/ActR/RegA family two-component response regulator
MSLSQSIAPHLPYLRRFGRALAGSQPIGDGYVVGTLEAVLAEPEMLPPGDDLRAGLYRVFLRVWGMTHGKDGSLAESGDEERGAHDSLARVSSRSRIAFLLKAVEGFGIADVGKILDCSPAEVSELLDEAGRQIGRQIRTDVLIIEDEPLIALDIRVLVEELGHKVVGVARTHRQAVSIVEQQSRKPGMVLADIQLADGSSGLDAVNEILESMQVPIIFVTAFPERFLTGRVPEPAFLVSKPFNADSLKAIISQVLFFDRKAKARPERSVAVE